jgi:SagB-type dehydrogenase family enzyme
MRAFTFTFLLSLFIGVLMITFFVTEAGRTAEPPSSDTTPMPTPVFDSKTSVETAIFKRRSLRDYSKQAITLTEISQLLWAAQGITEPDGGYLSAPSAGALYPLEIYIIVGNVEELTPGIYKYQPFRHELIRVAEGDVRKALSKAALGQDWVKDGAVVLLISAVYERITGKYRDRGIRYVHMEAGHAAQNVFLQAVSLNLGTVVVGAFHDDEVKKVMKLAEDEEPLCLMPVGRKND